MLDKVDQTRKEGQKKPWQKPVVVLLDVGKTATGPIFEEIEDPNFGHYGPES